MTFDRAIEILDPEHREHYEFIDPVNDACRMGMEALKKQLPMNPDVILLVLFAEGLQYMKIFFVRDCGQAIDWSESYHERK